PGVGEGAPRDQAPVETIEHRLDLMLKPAWPAMLDRQPSLAEAIGTVRALSLPAVPGDERGCIGNAARCAAELALLDAFGKYFGASLLTLVTLIPEAAGLYERRKWCQYSGAITSKSRARELISAIKQRVF